MKNKYGLFMMVLLLASASLAGTACLCASADCSSSNGTPAAKVPLCHHAAAPAQSQGQAPKNCCGKCQIEKAAILAQEFLSLEGLSQKQGFLEKGRVETLKGGVLPAFYSQSESPGSPPLFFTEYILGTTFAFRGPPAV